MATINKYNYLRLITRQNRTNNIDPVNIITNYLSLSEDEICNIYSKRWNIEEYYKQLKHNYKYQSITLQSHEKIIRHYYNILIISMLKQIIIDTYKLSEKYKEKIINNKKGDQLKTKINENNVISLLFDHLLAKIINKQINIQLIEIINKSFIINYNKINVLNKRSSKRPFSKWYIKQYHEKINIINSETTHKIKQTTDKNKLKAIKDKKKKYLILKKKY